MGSLAEPKDGLFICFEVYGDVRIDSLLASKSSLHLPKRPIDILSTKIVSSLTCHFHFALTSPHMFSLSSPPVPPLFCSLMDSFQVSKYSPVKGKSILDDSPGLALRKVPSPEKISLLSYAIISKMPRPNTSGLLLDSPS